MIWFFRYTTSSILPQLSCRSRILLAGKLVHKKAKTKQSPMQASLDRIDSSLGYVPRNIQFIALMANYAKNTFEDDAMIYFCKAVAKKHSGLVVASATEIEEIEQKVAALDIIFP